MLRACVWGAAVMCARAASLPPEDLAFLGAGPHFLRIPQVPPPPLRVSVHVTAHTLYVQHGALVIHAGLLPGTRPEVGSRAGCQCVCVWGGGGLTASSSSS